VTLRKYSSLFMGSLGETKNLYMANQEKNHEIFLFESSLALGDVTAVRVTVFIFLFAC
jgi:hypothetical protein